METTIEITKETKKKLDDFRNKGESYNSLIKRLIDEVDKI